MRPSALISLHDVMPHTLADVHASLDLLATAGISRVALLVVPGAAWQPADLDALRALDAQGHELLAHGWQRQTKPLHRLHASLISRNAAEHLGLGSNDITGLMCRSQRWFQEQGLQVPDTYVPPAWALGSLTDADMQALPYAAIETLRGVRVRQSHGRYRLLPMPLLGFEADSALRVRFLSDWNRLQLRIARRQGKVPRIALHPADYRLPMRNQLRAILALGWTSLPYATLCDPLSARYSGAPCS